MLCLVWITSIANFLCPNQNLTHWCQTKAILYLTIDKAGSRNDTKKDSRCRRRRRHTGTNKIQLGQRRISGTLRGSGEAGLQEARKYFRIY